MQYPKLRELNTSRQMVDVFRGYNHNLRIGEGEFYEMQNMTSDHYPVLAPRGRRAVVSGAAKAGGMIAKEELCIVDGSKLLVGNTAVEMGLSVAEEDCPKQLTSMGAYVIIMPDKKYINTADPEDFGDIEASFVSSGVVTFTMCTAEGESYEHILVSSDMPGEEMTYDLWIDASTKPYTPRRYSEATGTWEELTSIYVRIGAQGIGRDFREYDTVTISGIVKSALKDLNANLTVWARGDDFLVVSGVILSNEVRQTLEEGAIRAERRMPNVDFLVEADNRLWGCRYGEAANGEFVNEIYASKLGDFRNWNSYLGISTDSYAASCGTDGPFTGAVNYLGHPLFWKETCVHKVYGNYPANFQIQSTLCRGVQKGSHKSLAMLNEVLYYKSRGGVCAFDGSLPVDISADLGRQVYSDAVAGGCGDKYYISMKDAKGAWHLFVYDTAKGIWHREDDFHATEFCCWHDALYGQNQDNHGIFLMAGSDNPTEEAVEWMVQTGEIGISSPDTKYISSLTIRMAMDIGAEARFYGQYDFSNGWESLGVIRCDSLRSFSIPICPRRCDHMRLRIEGRGDVKIYSITKTVEEGSDVP